jgi:ABC-type branched-subunit amino acid transport system ATPase component
MGTSMPLLQVDGLRKQYTRGWPRRETTFRLAAHFTVHEPQVIGVMGPNGSGKTTLFELITGSNQPSAGEVRVAGRNIHQVRRSERDRLAIHYHQSYQVRAFQRGKPDVLLQRAGRSKPLVHLFDEPQFNTQDGYIGFMLDFFRHLRADGHVVFLCVHPNERFHLEILREICERYLFVHQGAVTESAGFEALVAQPAVRSYLGALAPAG